MPEPQVTSKIIKPPDLLNPDIEQLQEYAVNLFIEKLTISLGYAILSALIVFITALCNDIRFMVAFIRAVTAFFVSGVAAALITNVLDMQQEYFSNKKSQTYTTQTYTTAKENVNDAKN